MTDSDSLRMFTIYDHPKDFPHGYVMRSWVILGGVTDPVPEAAAYVHSIEQARLLIPPDLFCMNRQPGDDPTIVETWI